MKPTFYVKSRIEAKQKTELELAQFLAEFLEAKDYEIAGFSVKESSDGGFGRKIDIQIKSLDKEAGQPLSGWPFYSPSSKRKS